MRKWWENNDKVKSIHESIKTLNDYKICVSVHKLFCQEVLNELQQVQNSSIADLKISEKKVQENVDNSEVEYSKNVETIQTLKCSKREI